MDDALFPVPDGAQVDPGPPLSADIPAEIWRPIPGLSRDYEVSSEGNVRSRRRPGAAGGLLKIRKDAGGYPIVTLTTAGKPSTHRIHRLVALAFLGPAPDGQIVRHLDGNPSRSILGNLAYGTHSDNRRDQVGHGRNENANKTHCPQGHPYDDENTYRVASRPTSRYCRACKGNGPRPLKPCGTRAAYERHLAHGETPCDPCCAAYAERNRSQSRKAIDRAPATDHSYGDRRVSEDAARWVPESAGQRG